MPYKDPIKQKQAQARYFQENKTALVAVLRNKRRSMRQFVQKIKESTPCKDCEETFPHYIMDFDHLPGQKKTFGVAQISRCSSIDALKKEIAKCDIVCANCHRHRTFMRSAP